MSRYLRTIIVSASLGALAGIAGPIGPVIAQPSFYDIAPGPLDAVLIEFAEEARVSVNFSGIDFAGIRSGGAKRYIAKEAALRSILQGTGFAFRFTSDTTVVIFKPAEPVTAAEAAPEPENLPAARPDAIEDLVVTAVKRPSNIFRLPVSVTGVSSLMMEDLGAFDLQTLAPHIAGFTTTNLGPGRNKIFVRGLSDGPFADRTQAMVGVYIDETPVNLNDTNPDIRLFDAERVELVRGPQGTLYGAGTLGGLYRIITNKPVLDDTSARVRITGSGTRGGGENGLLDLVFNTPIKRDTLGFRVTGYVDIRDGYIDDLEREEVNTNDLSIYGIRPSLRWKLAADWMLDTSMTVQSIRYDDSQYFISDLGRNQRANTLPEPYDDDFIQANLTLTGRFGEINLTSASAYIDRTITEAADATDGLGFIEEEEDISNETFVRSDIAQFGGASEFLDFLDSEANGYLTRDNIHTFSHETRLQTDPGGRFDWVAGVYFLHRKQRMRSALLLIDDPDTVSVALEENRLETTRDIAVFGEAVYRLTDRFSLTGGLRASRHTLRLDYSSQFELTEETTAVSGGKTTEKVIPKLAMMYQWSDSIQTYAQASVGYRVGGLNINTPLDALAAADPDEDFPDEFIDEFQSDDLINYEVGIKSYWFDRRLSLNLSVFHVRWFDIQSDQIGPSGLPFVTNVGNATSEGYEVEFSATPLPGLELRGTYFWNDAKLTTDNSFLNADSGDRLPAIPERSLSLAALYQAAIGTDWTATFSADYAYIGEAALAFNEDDSPTFGDYGMLNARIQFTNGVWRFGVFGDNLTDTFANTFSFGNGFILDEEDQITPPRPRTFGLFVERSF